MDPVTLYVVGAAVASALVAHFGPKLWAAAKAGEQKAQAWVHTSTPAMLGTFEHPIRSAEDAMDAVRHLTLRAKYDLAASLAKSIQDEADLDDAAKRIDEERTLRRSLGAQLVGVLRPAPLQPPPAQAT